MFGLIGVSILIVITHKLEQAPIFFMIPWFFFSCVLLFIIFLVNVSSSRTIFHNISIFNKCRQVQMKLCSRKYLNYARIVKLDLVNEYKTLLLKCSFTFSNSSRINNKFFAFTMFGVASFFYMQLITYYRI